MPNQEFERKVREKLQDMQLDPSASVWDRVQKQVGGYSRKGGLGIGRLLILFVSLFCLLVGGYWYFHRLNQSKSLQSGVLSKGVINSVQRSDQGRNNYDRTDSVLEKKTQQSQVRQSATWSRSAAAAGGSTFLGSKSWKSIANNTLKGDKEPFATSSGKVSKDGQFDHENSKYQLPKSDVPFVASSAILSSSVNSENVSSTKSTQRADSGGAVISTVPVEKKEIEPRWKFGFTAAGGVSWTTQKISPVLFYAPLSTYGSSTTAAPASLTYGSPGNKPTPGPSFSVGILIERKLGKNVFVSMGLQYHYFATFIKTGPKMDSMISVNALGVSSRTKDGYFKQGTSNLYTNRYHFIELPVTVGYQFAQVGNLSIAASGGLSLAGLVGSNALLYDQQSAVYYPQQHNLNQAQLDATLAVLGSIRQGQIYYQFGPVFQYGLTNMFVTYNSDHQHLFYCGLQVVLLPWKK